MHSTPSAAWSRASRTSSRAAPAYHISSGGSRSGAGNSGGPLSCRPCWTGRSSTWSSCAAVHPWPSQWTGSPGAPDSSGLGPLLFSSWIRRIAGNRSGSWYDVSVLCWRNGQRSTIHDHLAWACCRPRSSGRTHRAPFWPGVKGCVPPIGSQDYPTGEILGSQDLDTHQVCNLEPHEPDLVTLHAYSPAFARDARLFAG
jgi:hypothetical protein